MRINNIGEFKTFIIENNLDTLDSAVADYIACVSQYNLFCSCKKTQKSQKHEQCNQQYIHVALNILPPNKNLLFSKIKYDIVEFYYNQSYHIITLSR